MSSVHSSHSIKLSIMYKLLLYSYEVVLEPNRANFNFLPIIFQFLFMLQYNISVIMLRDPDGGAPRLCSVLRAPCIVRASRCVALRCAASCAASFCVVRCVALRRSASCAALRCIVLRHAFVGTYGSLWEPVGTFVRGNLWDIRAFLRCKMFFFTTFFRCRAFSHYVFSLQGVFSLRFFAAGCFFTAFFRCKTFSHCVSALQSVFTLRFSL